MQLVSGLEVLAAKDVMALLDGVLLVGVCFIAWGLPHLRRTGFGSQVEEFQ